MPLTKLRPPQIRSQVVLREQLDVWIQAAKNTRLVVIRAPAGFGKTTMMVQWLARVKEMGRVTVWLSLDKSDNDPHRFFANLLGAIQAASSDFSFDDFNVPSPADTTNPVGTILYIIDKLATSPAPLTIFMDDFGAIENPEVESAVQKLINLMPVDKRLIISMRQTPNLELGKLRSQGQVIEIDSDCLRFDQKESAEYLLQTQDLRLSPDDMEWLFQTTEGWIAGMQLYALSLKLRKGVVREPIRRLSGGFKQISDYLTEDVLIHQPENVQNFLLKTSILDRLTGPLCDALTGGSDGADILEYLDKQNLFVTPIDEESQWYRYHSLFRKFLKSRLERGLRERVVLLHGAAAQWFIDQNSPEEAVGHALSADDIDSAIEILEGCVTDLIMGGYSATIIGLAGKIPLERLVRSQKIAVIYCWANLLKENFDKVNKIINAMEETLSQEEIINVSADLQTFKGLIALAQDRQNDEDKLIFDVLSSCGEQNFISKGPLYNLASYLRLCSGHHAEAMELAGQSARIAENQNDVGGLSFGRFLVALHELLHGRLRSSISIAREAIAERSDGPIKYSPVVMAIAVVLAEALYEINELDEADKLLDSYRSLLPSSMLFPDVTLMGYLCLARIKAARGELLEAGSVLAELERIASYAGFPRLLATARIEKIRTALGSAEVETAIRISREWDDVKLWEAFDTYTMPSNDLESFHLNQIRLLIARGKAKKALDLLRVELKTAEATGWFRRQLKARLLMVKAYDASNQRRTALRTLRETVLLSQNEGFIRSYVDEGEPFPALMLDLRKTVSPHKEDRDELSGEYLDRLLVAMGQPVGTLLEEASVEEFCATEPLSGREIKVLEKLALGLSNDEIADQCCVSVNTVRFHLRNVNAKLGTKSRTEALVVARRTGAIE